MRKKPLPILMLAVTAVCFTTAALHSCGTGKGRIPMPEIPEDSLREGDLAFRRGHSLASDAVILADPTKGAYSHIGIIARKEGEWCVVHAVPGECGQPGGIDTVKTDPLEEFFSAEKASAGEIIRTGGDSAALENAARKALGKIGVQFDHDYDLADTSRLYCTELVSLSFRNAGIRLRLDKLERVGIAFFKGDYLLPSNIYRNNRVKTVFKF